MGASSAPSGSREASPERREPRGMAPGTPFTGRPGGAPAALPPSGASQSPSCASPAGSVSGASSPSAPAGAAVPRSSAEFQGHLRRMTNNLMEIFDQLGQPVRAGDAAVGAGASPGERLVTVSEVEPLTVSEVGVPAALAPPSTPAPPSEDASAVQLRALTSSMVDILRQMSQAGASLREDGKKDEAHGLLPDNASELSLDDKLSLVSGATSAGKNSYSSANSHTALLKGYGGIPAQEEYVGDAVQPWWADRVGEAGAAGPDGPPAPEGDDGLVYEAKEAPVPAVLEKKKATNWFGLFAFCFYICAFCFYVFIRATKTLGLGSLLWYGLLVLGVEIIGGLAMLPYGVCLVARVVNGAPPAPDERGVVRTLARYHVRVLIPCYKEPLDVISKTLLAALYASVPANCQRTVYLLDDGRDPDKRGFVRSLGAPNAVYVSGRKRGKSEMNGKSANINNAVRLIYPDLAACPLSEVCCVFDADQVPNADFFLKMVPLLDGGKDVGMVLSPQTFYNLNPDGDIFNHANVHFWDYAQPGYDALGLISCTGTNFLVRSRAFCQAGLFPEWTLTEDFALGIELKKLGWQCRYVQEYLAIGEAPDDVRNCFQQRSRWSKGHFQVFFSRHNPLIGRGLSPFMRWMYGSVILSYFSAFLATPLLMLVPMITVWFGSFPIVINQWAAISITVYYAATLLVNYYCHSLGHLKSMWFSGIANNVLWYAFLKAMYRATIGRWIDGNIVFKVTAKGLQRMGALPLRDVWMALFFFTTMLVTLVFGLVHYSRGPASTPLTISLIFMAINLLPNYLLLQYALWRPRAFFNAVCKVAMFLSTGLMILGLVLVWCLYPRSYNFGASLGSGVFFLDTQRVGALPADYPVSWRGSSFLSEQKSVIWVAYNSTTNSNGQTVVSPPPPFSFDNLFGRRLQQQGGGDQWLNDLFSGQASETSPGGSSPGGSSPGGSSPAASTSSPPAVSTAPPAASKSPPAAAARSPPAAAARPPPAASTTPPPLAGRTLGSPPPAAKIPLLDDSASADPFGSSASPSSVADDPFAPKGSSPSASPSSVADDPFAPKGSSPSASPSSAADDPFAPKGSSPGAAPSSSSPGASDSYDPFSGLDSSFTSTFGSADPFNTNPGGVRVVPQAKLLTGASWDLSGGFLTGMLGGNLKATSPVAFSTALLAWGLSSFGEAYDEAGVRQQLLDNVRWGSDYLMKVHQTVGKQELIVTRVGDVESEVQLWYRPEDSSAARPAYAVDMVEGASDLGGSVAAALAASSVVFRAADDAAYASTLLTKAEQIYQIAKANLGFYSVQDFNASLLYNSTTYYDDLAWAAAWLYKATAQSNYLSDLYDLYVRHLHYEDDYDASYVFDWDQVFWPTNVLMAQESGVATFVSQSQTYLQHWLCANQAANYTLRGRAYNPSSPSTGATLNTAMTALMFADVVSHTDAVAAKAYRCWALGQIRYVLGDSGRSLTVGVGKQPPERTQDRDAACPDRPQTCNRVTGLLSPDPDTYALRGALVYGPGDSDYFVDDRKDESNQVGIENNAGFIGAIAGAALLPSGMWEQCLQDYGIYRVSPICGRYVTV